MAPIFVGSNSDDTRIRSNRVGLAASTSDPGTASEGDIYYDSTNNKVKTYDGSAWSAIQGSGTVELVASGSLSNGQTVIIQSDGKVVGVNSTGIPPEFGSATEFESDLGTTFSTAYDSSNNKVVIAYRDEGNSNYGTAVVATVSGTSISFGTPVVFATTTNTKDVSATFDSTNGKVVIAYRNDDSSDAGKAIVGNVSGTSISFGSAVTFETNRVSNVGITFDSTNGKVVIAYRDHSSSQGKAIVGTVSGTSISFGSSTAFNSSTAYTNACTFDSTNGKVVIAYRDGGDSSKAKAIVGTVSGTSISFGSAQVFFTPNAYYISSTFDSTNGKVVIVYYDNDNNRYGTAIVGTVSGTSISFGTAVVFTSSDTEHTSVVYDSSNNKVIIAYQNQDNSNYGTAIVGTVSGTSISFGSASVFNSTDTRYCSAVYDSSNDKVVIAYREQNDNSGHGIVFKTTSSSNLTSENFIGFSDAAYTDGQTANIQIISSIDDAQSGLTTGSLHYVQNDGSLSTTAGNPSVEAGTALSGTEILIKQ